MNSHRWFANCTAALLAACAFWASAAAQGQFFRDDFEDGDITDDSPVSWIPTPGFDTGTREVVDGDLVLTPTATTLETDTEVANRIFGDVSLRAVVYTVGDGGSAMSNFGLYARGAADGPHPGQGYSLFGGINDSGTNRRFYFGWASPEQPFRLLGTAPIPWNVAGRDIRLQLDVMHKTLSFKAWPVEDAEPTAPQLSADISFFPIASGSVGIFLAPTSDLLLPLRVRSFEAVPEPQSAALLGMTLGGCSLSRRRRFLP